MHKDITKELLDAVEEIQRRSIRLGGRIQLATYRAPDDSDVQAIPDDLEYLGQLLDYLGERISETVNGPYLIAEYLPGRKGLVLTGYEPKDYHDAAETADILNILRNARPHLAPISLNDVQREDRWQVVALNDEGEITSDTRSMAMPMSQGLEQAQAYAQQMNDTLHATDPDYPGYYAAATYDAVYGDEVRVG